MRVTIHDLYKDPNVALLCYIDWVIGHQTTSDTKDDRMLGCSTYLWADGINPRDITSAMCVHRNCGAYIKYCDNLYHTRYRGALVEPSHFETLKKLKTLVSNGRHFPVYSFSTSREVAEGFTYKPFEEKNDRVPTVVTLNTHRVKMLDTICVQTWSRKNESFLWKHTQDTAIFEHIELEKEVICFGKNIPLFTVDEYHA